MLWKVSALAEEDWGRTSIPSNLLDEAALLKHAQEALLAPSLDLFGLFLPLPFGLDGLPDVTLADGAHRHARTSLSKQALAAHPRPRARSVVDEGGGCH